MNIRRVLLVDDDAAIRRITEITLSRIAKWEVLATESGQNALQLLPSFKPDLILLDVMMPGMDGPSTLKALQQSQYGNNIPVIFMTARVQKHELAQYYQMGAKGVITKPFNPVTLSSEIDAELCSSCGLTV